MNVRTLFLPLAAAVPFALSTPAVLANPHTMILVPAHMSTVYRPMHPAHTKHLVMPPTYAPPPAFAPAYGPFAFPSWPAGFGAFSLMGMGLSSNNGSCSTNAPRTLGDLGFVGAAGASNFAPVTLSQEPAFDMLPSQQPLLPAQSYCQPPSLDLSTFTLGD